MLYPFLFGWKQHTVDLAVWWSTVAHNMYSYAAGSLPEACLAKAWSQRLPTRRQGQKSCVVSMLKVGVTHCGYIQKYTGKGSQNHELANIGACSKFKLLQSSIVLFEVLLTTNDNWWIIINFGCFFCLLLSWFFFDSSAPKHGIPIIPTCRSTKTNQS